VIAPDAHDHRTFCSRCDGTLSLFHHATAGEVHYLTTHHARDMTLRANGHAPDAPELTRAKKLDCVVLHMIDTGSSKRSIAKSHFLRTALGMLDGEWLTDRKIQERLEFFAANCEEGLQALAANLPVDAGLSRHDD
jgi:hypothetical protein